MSIPMITFVGRSGSGKTTLLVKLIAELRQRGYRLATIKHHSHSGFEIDQPGKDSWRHARAGSEHVVIVAPAKMASYRQLDHEIPLAEVVSGISGVDLILIEGYKGAALPTVEVVRAANSLDLVGRPEFRFAVAADVPLDMDVPQFHLDDVQGLADCIQARFLNGTAANGGSLAARAGDGTVRISYAEALAQTLAHISPLEAEIVGLVQACGRVVAEDLQARVDSPSLDASLKDGYAVRSADVAGASPQQPVRLRLAGLAAAGGGWNGTVQEGMAVRILTGAPIPGGAQAVVSAEFTTDDGQGVTIANDAKPGRNVLLRGSDVAIGQRIVAGGELLRPTQAGLLAAAGYDRIPVVRRPRVAIVATGDEVVAPGQPLAAGKLYASNLVTLAAWCAHFGLEVTTAVVPDCRETIRAELERCIADCDAILTSGGAWNGERDLVVRLLDELGWQKVYHRVRIGPGKAVAFGLWQGKPVFCLPGGPPSNHMAFLQLALPGLHRLEGREQVGLPLQVARLAEPVTGQRDWTQFVHGRLAMDGEGLLFHPLRMKSRLQEMAQTEAILQIGEGSEGIDAGAVVSVQLLAPGQSLPPLDSGELAAPINEGTIQTERR
jgi:molybdopterin molybdotransferase